MRTRGAYFASHPAAAFVARAVGAAAIIAVLFVIRAVVADSGGVNGESALRALTIAFVAFSLLALLVFFRRYGLQNVAAAGALFAGTFALVDAAIPISPDLRLAPACPGARVSNVPYLAVTGDNGVNVRAGPGRDFLQLDRLAGGCTVGFVSYCFGEPYPDLNQDGLNTPDLRWLRLPSGGFVHAGVVRSQDPEGSVPFASCPGGEAPPTTPQLLIDDRGSPDHLWKLAAVSPDAAVIGFAGYDPPRRGTHLHRSNFDWIRLDTRRVDGFTAAVGLGRGLEELAVSRRAIYIAAVPCLAAEVPADVAKILRVTVLADGSVDVAPLTLPAFTKIEGARAALRLRKTACLLKTPDAVQQD